ncbi:hypothetical protein EDB85DRAFT_1904616 [Lactarius pseudohatsudake]|nr:hypothetical protein EDB85DRAFT_1904616 [Lactarius pseudohatsudake]
MFTPQNTDFPHSEIAELRAAFARGLSNSVFRQGPFRDRHRPTSNISHPAEACVTVRNASHPQNLVHLISEPKGRVWQVAGLGPDSGVACQRNRQRSIVSCVVVLAQEAKLFLVGRHNITTPTRPHDTDVVPGPPNTDAAPRLDDTNTTPHPYDTNAAPCPHDTVAALRLHDTDMVPAADNTNTALHPHDTDATRRHHDTVTAPRPHDTDAVPGPHNTNMAPHPHDTDAAPRQVRCADSDERNGDSCDKHGGGGDKYDDGD